MRVRFFTDGIHRSPASHIGLANQQIKIHARGGIDHLTPLREGTQKHKKKKNRKKITLHAIYRLK
jgi:hypothetical protein